MLEISMHIEAAVCKQFLQHEINKQKDMDKKNTGRNCDKSADKDKKAHFHRLKQRSWM